MADGRHSGRPAETHRGPIHEHRHEADGLPLLCLRQWPRFLGNCIGLGEVQGALGFAMFLWPPLGWCRKTRTRCFEPPAYVLHCLVERMRRRGGQLGGRIRRRQDRGE